MKKTLVLILYLCVLVFIPIVSEASIVDKAIKEIFSLYKQALKVKSGGQASALVSKQTLDYYENLRKLSLKASAAEVKSLSISEKMIVLLYRLRVSKNELRNMNGKNLFIYSVNKGLVSEDSIRNVELGAIDINGNVALAVMMSRGKQSDLKLRFDKENNSWKFNLVSMMSAMDEPLQKLAKMKNMSEDDVAVFLVERASGMKVTPRLWDGPRN